MTAAELSGDGSGELVEHRDELIARAESYARGARAANTWSAYERQWRRFETWCAAAGERALPADPLTVARFLADLAPVWRPATPADPSSSVVAGQVCEREGLRPGTLSGYLAAISVVHQTAQLDNPVQAEAVRRTITGIRRHPGVAPTRRRAAARREPLVEVLRLLRPEEVLADARDHALLLVGWKAALRTDDLARLQMADLHPSDQGLSVHLSRSKTDQHGTGTTIGIAAPSPETMVGEGSEESTLLDAGAAWTRWRDLLGSEAAARVELVLNETGVCGGAGLFDADTSAAETAEVSGCCGPAEPEQSEARVAETVGAHGAGH